MVKKYDVIVIGAGPAGYTAAIRASQMQSKVLLVEKSNVGGTCLNWGCIPTKYLSETLHIQDKIKRNIGLFPGLKIDSLNFKTAAEKRDKTVSLLVKGLKKTIESYSIDIIQSEASFVSKNEIKAGNGQFKADKIIIATGSSPCDIPGLKIDHNRIIDTADFLTMAELPQSFSVIGAGVAGIEITNILSSFGCKVRLIEKENKVLPMEDDDISEYISKNFEKNGVEICTGTSDAAKLSEGFDKVLITVGRKPNIEKLNLEKAGVNYSEKGIKVDDNFVTSNPDIYAAGDVTGRACLAYISQSEGACAAENALGRKNETDYSTVPAVVFYKTPFARVGFKERDFPKEKIAVGRFPLTANSKAFIEGERDGWVKVIADKLTGKILGGQIVGNSAENLITVFALAVNHKMTLKDLKREIFFHPSLAESIHSACEDAKGKCIELPKK